MLKGFVLAVAMLMVTGCGSFGGFFGENGELPPFAQAILTKCETVPVAQFDNCVKDELNGVPTTTNVDNLTVGDLLSMFPKQPVTE